MPYIHDIVVNILVRMILLDFGTSITNITYIVIACIVLMLCIQADILSLFSKNNED